MKYLRSAGKPKPRVKNYDIPEESSKPVAKKPRKEFKQFPQVFMDLTIPPGEDEASNSRNQKMLSLEEKKVHPNKSTISVLMDRTFAFRRQDIMKSVRPVKEILTTFPSLKRLEQVLCIAHT